MSSERELSWSTVKFQVPYNGEQLGIHVIDSQSKKFIFVAKVEARSPLINHLREGDVIRTINGIPTPSGTAMADAIKLSKGTLSFIVRRKTVSGSLSLPLVAVEKFDYFSASVNRDPNQSIGVGLKNKTVGGLTVVVICKIVDTSLLRGKIRLGDYLLAINGIPVIEKNDVMSIIGDSTFIKLAMARRKETGADDKKEDEGRERPGEERRAREERDEGDRDRRRDRDRENTSDIKNDTVDELMKTEEDYKQQRRGGDAKDRKADGSKRRKPKTASMSIL